LLPDEPGARSPQDCDLPANWARRTAWTVLDTDFLDGSRFLKTWSAWRGDPNRPRTLHYVGIAAGAICLDSTVLPASDTSPETTALEALKLELGAQCKDLEPGFRRILLDHGSVSLTLCLGSVDAMLGEHVFQADTLYACAPGNKWTAQLMARRCRRGARFWLSVPPEGFHGALAQRLLTAILQTAGFQLDAGSASPSSLAGRFDPTWNTPASRHHLRQETPVPGRCAVIGAGLAGASVAHALALRGWQVTVLDQEATPASGASGLPAGLAVPHVSVDNSPRSRISRSGIRLMVQHANRLLAIQRDWMQSGVLERRPDGTALWHPEAAWVKPRNLVQAWLAHTGIAFVGNTKIASLQRSDGLWSLRDVQGQKLGPFDEVVLANAMGCRAILKAANAHDEQPYLPDSELADKMSALQAIHGTLSHGTYAEAVPGLPETPVNGNGCFIPHVPDVAGEQWCAGSTFEPDGLVAADTWAQHALNMARLRHLLPGVGAELAETLDRGPVSQWSATRCVTHDRMPLVGPVDSDTHSWLWLCIGMGSRGLSFSALCAELLVARLCAEPLPLELSLSRSLDANRVRRKRKLTSSD
jgi:tRNA 5-methylaminomethyl-2-thiouridine biosynthesis bifunctional protein